MAGYAGQTVSIRYDPRDITTVWIYRQEKNHEVFLTRAHAHDLETEHLALDEAKASAKRVRTAGKNITNQAILYDVVERAIERETSKPTRKQRQQDEQAHKKSSAVSNNVVESPKAAVKPESTAPLDTGDSTDIEDQGINRSTVDEMEVWDYEQMRQEYGW